MDKKIKIIELFNIIAQVEDIGKLPKKIKYYDYIYELQIASRDYYCKAEGDYLTDRVDDKPLNSFLNDTVEILEDNTEEIEELNLEALNGMGGFTFTEIEEVAYNKINEIIKKLNQLTINLENTDK